MAAREAKQKADKYNKIEKNKQNFESVLKKEMIRCEQRAAVAVALQNILEEIIPCAATKGDYSATYYVYWDHYDHNLYSKEGEELILSTLRERGYKAKSTKHGEINTFCYWRISINWD